MAPYNLTTSAADFSVCQVSDYVTEDDIIRSKKINKQSDMVAIHKMPVSLGFVGNVLGFYRAMHFSAKRGIATVSYTHLTLPTKRIV